MFILANENKEAISAVWKAASLALTSLFYPKVGVKIRRFVKIKLD